MTRTEQKTVDGDACLAAAERIRSKLQDLTQRIGWANNPALGPVRALPVDDFLAGMVTRKNAPRIVLQPKRLRNKTWTESVFTFVYAGIEQAFVRAGKLPGGNRSGHVKKLRELKAWAVRQEETPSRKIPKHFVQKTALLFSKGILEERRKTRIETINRIGYSAPSLLSDLSQLKKWIDEDLSDSLFRKKGRSTGYQKIIFAAEIANLWYRLTGLPISRGPDTNFARFVTACWNSGFVDVEVNANFKRTIRHHIAENTERKRCGLCDGCLKSGKCERKSYYGILI